MKTMEDILQNEDLMQKLAEVDSPAALGAVLAENNIAPEEGLSVENLYEILKNPDAASDELDEDDLGDVSGGAILRPIWVGGVLLVGKALIKYLAKQLKKRK